ncbi:hypothetical protein EII34_05855 [Arachnia propionica]|uniref:DDE Tnp4 domain-containing protein n=1 Tax=Arachnia propionica TaxID=1750 RepID=A0A3P1TB84_9ACTN|nr:hypothetical protein EII34_05855 [Arachnia propionica]
MSPPSVTSPQTPPSCPAGPGAPAPTYSGKHHSTGVDIQVVTSLTGDILWVSDPLTGNTHDVTALDTHHLNPPHPEASNLQVGAQAPSHPCGISLGSSICTMCQGSRHARFTSRLDQREVWP